MTPDEIRAKFKDASAEFSELVRSGATKAQLRNGANGKCGLNQVTELFMLLPEGPSAEFGIKE